MCNRGWKEAQRQKHRSRRSTVTGAPLENLPHFMASVEEVAPATSNTNHWRIKETFGRTLECEARTTHRETNSAIEWNHTRRQHTQWPIC